MTCRILATLIAATLPSATVHAASKIFDHIKLEPRQIGFSLSNGEVFTITVTNTRPDCFSYNLSGVLLRTPTADDIKIAADSASFEKKLADVPFAYRHDDQYGGYVLHIKRKTEVGALCDDAYKTLDVVDVFVSVAAVSWNVRFAGGFTASGLTDPVFALEENSQGNNVVTRTKEAEDVANLGIGAFIHVYRDNWKWYVPAMTFGLGVSEGNKTTYYFAPSWRFGDQAFVSTGVVLGPINHPRAGVREGDVVADPNALNSLDARTTARTFVAFSYTFFNVRQQLEQPFKVSHQLTVRLVGDGNGTVTGDSLVCTKVTAAQTECVEDYPVDRPVTLTASGTGSDAFEGWSAAACTGTGACRVTLTGPQTVEARFKKP